MIRFLFSIAVFSSLLSTTSMAQEVEANSVESDAQDTLPLETIVVVGTRTERAQSDVAATVSVKDLEQIESEMVRDIADLIRYEPGVSVGGTGSRFGLDGFIIRGIGGNRVLTLVDGIRTPEEFSFGPFLSSRRNFVDIDSLDQVEIARGPISSLYGSDALGGVVAFRTKGPRDYLDGDGNDTYFALKGGYDSAEAGFLGTATFATGNDKWAGMFLYTRRDGDETENQGTLEGTGPTREKPDPTDTGSDNASVKVSYKLNEQNEFTLNLSHFDGSTITRILSDYNVVSRGVLTTSRNATDDRTRDLYSLAWAYRGDLKIADRIDATVYRQRSKSEQLTEDERISRGSPQGRFRSSLFEQDITGAFAQFGKALTLGGAQHYLSYGVDYYQTDNDSLRNGGSFDLITDAPIREFFPFPTRDFPVTEVKQLAFYLQDEITLFDERLILSPGIRYDQFDANSTADDIFLTGNPGSPLPEDYDDSEFTAKIGAVFKFNENFSIYGSYSEGFRAPPYDDVNVGFTNFIGGYKTISNANLTSETSQGLEFGFRAQSEAGYFSIAAFKNEYEDFIESLAISPQFLASGGIDPADGLLTFQSINRDDVEIDGVEVSGLLRLGAVSDSFSGFSLRLALARADGEDQNTGAPINDVEPLSVVTGLSYEAPSRVWGGDVVFTMVKSKDEGDIDPDNPRLAIGGYTVIDILAHYNPTKNIRINAGLFNITDRSYIRWADTIGIGSDAPARFTQPGFNVGLTVRYETD
ncbi:MAG: TonB-dependent hemoglobin/transferrin/lactoferrin family receptor [Pseudomonadota bacterium]